MTSEKYVVKSYQSSTHSKAQNCRCTKKEIGRVMKPFCPSLAQRYDQLLAVNSNLHMVSRLCLIYTLHLCIYGNNGETNNLFIQQFSFCQGFIPLKLELEEKPQPKRCWKGKGGLSVYFSMRETFTEQQEGSNGNSLKVAGKAVHQVMRGCVSFIILISFSLRLLG